MTETEDAGEAGEGSTSAPAEKKKLNVKVKLHGCTRGTILFFLLYVRTLDPVPFWEFSETFLKPWPSGWGSG